MDLLTFIVEETKAVTPLVSALTGLLLVCLAFYVVRRHSGPVARLIDRLCRIEIRRHRMSAWFTTPTPTAHVVLWAGDSGTDGWKSFVHRDITAANILMVPHHGANAGFNSR